MGGQSQDLTDTIYGKRLVPLDLFCERLGVTASAVFLAMRHKRNAKAYGWHSYDWIGNHVNDPGAPKPKNKKEKSKKIGRSKAAHAAIRLRNVGLLRNVAWSVATFNDRRPEPTDLDLRYAPRPRFWPVRSAPNKSFHAPGKIDNAQRGRTDKPRYTSSEILIREWSGALAIPKFSKSNDQICVLVPEKVFWELADRNTWGGARRGPAKRADSRKRRNRAAFLYECSIRCPDDDLGRVYNPTGHPTKPEKPSWYTTIAERKYAKSSKISRRSLKASPDDPPSGDGRVSIRNSPKRTPAARRPVVYRTDPEIALARKEIASRVASKSRVIQGLGASPENTVAGKPEIERSISQKVSSEDLERIHDSIFSGTASTYGIPTPIAQVDFGQIPRFERSGVIPAMPVLPRVLVPEQPQLPKDDEAAIRFFANTIRDCIKIHFGSDMWPLRRNLSAKTKGQLLAAIKLLREHQLTPVTWVSFTIWYWQHYRPEWSKSPAPPLSWFLSKTLIERRHGWAAKEWSMQFEGSIVPNPYTAEMDVRRSAYMNDLSWVVGLSEEGAKKIYEKHFPQKWLKEIAERALRFKLEIEMSLGKRARNGNWIWGKTIALEAEPGGARRASEAKKADGTYEPYRGNKKPYEMDDDGDLE